MLKTLRNLAALAVTAVTLTACGGGHHETRSVVSVLAADPSTQVLATAIREAGLDSALAGPGPFTILAPTDAAFTALLAELGITQAQLLANKPLLTQVLQYHVLNGRVARAAVPLGKPITPLAGGIFKVESVSGELRVTDGRNRVSRITTTDIDGGNGVIHKLDRVLLPADKTIVQTAQSLPDFSILVEAVVAADLVSTLSGPGPFTVFAPTNAAFAAVPSDALNALLADKDALTDVLLYHVYNGVVPASVAVTLTTAEMANGDDISISYNAGTEVLTVGGATVTGADIWARNGVIHVINAVLLPQ